MLWRFGFTSTSSLDVLLSREIPPTVEEVMDEQDVLAECKAQNNKWVFTYLTSENGVLMWSRLVNYLSKEDTIKSLLQWVVSGLDELDQQAAQADSDSIDHIMVSPELYPSYQVKLLSIPGPGPGSPPLEPAKLAEEDLRDVSMGAPGDSGFSAGIGLGEGLETGRKDEEDPSRSR